MDMNAIRKKALNHYGLDGQLVTCIEELAELQKELTKCIRGIGSRDSVMEELADVLFIAEYIKDIFVIDDTDIAIHQAEKAKRLVERIQYEEARDAGL